jgi:hypothetical protein
VVEGGLGSRWQSRVRWTSWRRVVSDLVIPPKALDFLIEGKGSEAGSSKQTAGGGESVEDMLQRLNLTSKEADPLILEDEGDDDLPCPEWALVSKVLAPNPLHIDTSQTYL